MVASADPIARVPFQDHDLLFSRKQKSDGSTNLGASPCRGLPRYLLGPW